MRITIDINDGEESPTITTSTGAATPLSLDVHNGGAAAYLTEPEPTAAAASAFAGAMTVHDGGAASDQIDILVIAAGGDDVVHPFGGEHQDLIRADEGAIDGGQGPSTDP
jgi:hypothetical protein